jgi:hypothetical protein
VNMLVDVQTVSIVIAASGLFIAAVNSILSNRRTEKTQQLTLETRQAQLFMQVYSRWNSRDFAKAYGRVMYVHKWEDPEDWLQKFMADKNIEAYSDHQILSTYFEGLGVLLKQGLINISLIDDLLSDRIVFFYEYTNPLRQQGREMRNNPKLYASVEYLYNEMKKREQQQATTNT